MITIIVMVCVAILLVCTVIAIIETVGKGKLLCINTVVSQISAHGRLNITHNFGLHGRLPGI